MTDLSASHDARLSACPACDAAPLAQRWAEAGSRGQAPGDLILSLPTAHCAACITDVERALMAVPEVRSARVNLTLRRVAVDAPGLTAGDLIPVLDRIGFEAHELDPQALSSTAADRQGRDILMRIGVSGFAMMNIMMLSVAVWSGAEAATRDMFHWISGAIALPTVVFAGKPFFSAAWRGLKAGRMGMDLPIALAIILASAISIYETLQSGRHAYFDAAVMLCFFLLIGRYLDYRTRAVARSAAEELTALEVPRATLLQDGDEVAVPVADLRPGDLILIRPGARVAADGVIERGDSDIDRSALTGESIPVPAAPGAALSAGEVNLTGPIVLRVTAAGRDSSLARLTALVAAAESARGRYTSVADRMSRAYAPVVHILAFASLGFWLWKTGEARPALNIAAAVLIITCPCALGLAVPAVVTAASGRLFRRGLLIKDGTALERMAEIDTVVFDKTGTLTMGTPQLQSLRPLPVEMRPLAAALAGGSSHPLSRALAAALDGGTPAAVEDLREVPGHGVEARWNGLRVRLGRADWVGAEADAPGAATWLWVEGRPAIRLDFDDRLREGAEAAVLAIRRSGRRLLLLSGDHERSVVDTAARLGIDDWRAGVTPTEKAAIVNELTAGGARVLMVGDGLNDTGALAAAHASISPASALDAARVASDMVLLGGDLTPVAEALDVAGRSRKRIHENFAMSVAYNIVAVPFAMAGMASPLLAAVAMSASSICVTLNALRLR
ncbi:cadmium-translocating P-type ATPase [Paracoccus sp. Z118]|uniref:heavy metal translocating P-type ATPase n=1 Tax=Paracoccus sp. Z118 TaxID=2851017 RepID=UPI001C2BC09E|nr:heavy metal translocating P-type ATPase [Paracoccus sp. Z118]MBV0890996.1 cadmium-translocating P-type ATPase [Paracoccus sp. Z118]